MLIFFYLLYLVGDENALLSKLSGKKRPFDVFT